MEYIQSEKEYFQNFIVGGQETFDAYIHRKLQNGVWGDDLEIQALSEIYNRPIEIYAYSNEPMRTFHEQEEGNEPFRLSYHGRCHYNSIVSLNWNLSKVFVKSRPGEIENEAINYSRDREEEQEEEQTKIEEQQQQQVSAFQGPVRNEETLKLYRYIIQKSREEFEI